MSWFSRCLWCGGPFNGGNCRHCTNVSFEDEFVRNPDPISNDETPDFSYPPPQPQTSSLNQFHCFHCKDPLEEGERCQRCTCKWCGYGLREGSCWICPSRDENSSIDAPNSFNDLTNIFTYPPQPQYETYSCELCGNDSHHGYDCPPRFPLVYEQEPSYNQNFSDNYYPQNSPSFPQQYLCCENCGGPHESFQCQPMNQRHQNYSELNPCCDSNSYGFDQPTQYSIDHQPQSIQEDLNQQMMNDVHNKWDDMIESKNELLQSLGEILRQREQAANVSTHTPEPLRQFNIIYDYDDDDEESIIPLNEIVSQIPSYIAITPVLPTLEPEDSLILGDEDLSTILEKESDKVIKSGVEDSCSIPSERGYIRGDRSVITLVNDESLSDEDVPKENFKIYSNLLFEFDDEYISSDVNPLFNEVLEDIERKESYVSKLDEPDLLVTPLSKLNEDECFDSGGDFLLEEIKACLTSDSIPPGIDDDDFDPERDIHLREKLLNNDPPSPLPPKELNFEELKDTIPNLPPEVFLDHDPRSLEDEPDKDDLKNIVKVFDPGIWEIIFSPTYVKLPFEDRHYLSLTYVIRIFLPYFTYPVDSSLPLSSGS
ncbi:hypothetical protein Tco_0472220 [Tanacetum coccineum]